MAAAIHFAAATAPAPVRETWHKCPLGDKRLTLRGDKAVCRAHGSRLPEAVSKALSAAWDKGRGAGSPEFAAAVAAAEAALESKGEI